MKNLSKFCPEIFKSKLACVFLIAQLFFSAFILDWDKMFIIIESIEESRYKAESSEDAPNFCFSHHHYEGYSEVELAKVSFILVSLPTAIVTSYLLVDLKNQHPHWSYEKFVIIGNLAFLLFNSVWWLLLGYLIEIFHGKNLENRAEPEKPFTIFSGSD